MLIAGMVAMSGTAAVGVPDPDRQPNQPVSAAQRNVDGTYEGFTTSEVQCNNGVFSGIYVTTDVEANLSYLGSGSMHWASRSDGPGSWQFTTNDGSGIGGSFLAVVEPKGPDTYTYNDFVVDGGTGKFAEVAGLGGRLRNLSELIVIPPVFPPPCDGPPLTVPVSGELHGTVSFAGWGVTYGSAESGEATFTGDNPFDLNGEGLAVDEALNVEFDQFGSAIMETGFTFLPNMFKAGNNLGVKPGVQNTVVITFPDNPDWKLEGEVYAAAYNPWDGSTFSRQIRITSGEGKPFRQVSEGWLYLRNGFIDPPLQTGQLPGQQTADLTVGVVGGYVS